MKKLLKLSGSGLVALTLLAACESRPTVANGGATSQEDTIVVAKENTTASRELNEFKAWVNEKANRTDSSARENLPKAKAEFKERAARLDSKVDSLSAEGKAEYQRLKARYEGWEAKKENRESQPLDPAKLKQWEQTLLAGASLATLPAADMRETYLVFMGMVRAKKQRWTPDDWDYVDNVYSRLNARKQAVESGIPSADRFKIKTLQAEYLTLEAGNDARDMYQHVK